MRTALACCVMGCRGTLRGLEATELWAAVCLKCVDELVPWVIITILRIAMHVGSRRYWSSGSTVWCGGRKSDLSLWRRGFFGCKILPCVGTMDLSVHEFGSGFGKSIYLQ
jgi:hypothetical protein